MSAVWDKIFGQGPIGSLQEGANTKTFSKPGEGGQAVSSIASDGDPSDFEPRSSRSAAAIAATFDSIGQHNETLRNQLDSIEFAFRNVETIKTLFYNVLAPIDGLIREIERTKTELRDTTRRLSAISSAYDELKGDHAGAVKERAAAIENRDGLQEHARLLEQWLREAEAEVAEAQLSIADKDLRAERLERDFEGVTRRLAANEDEGKALREELEQKERLLLEVDQKRAALLDQHDIVTQESRSLRAKLEDLSTNASTMHRQMNELEVRHAETTRRAAELQSTLAQESAAHNKLKMAHQEMSDWNRANAATLQVDLEAMRARAEAAERILIGARQELHEKQAASLVLERQLHQASQAAQARDQASAALEKELTGARTQIEELEGSRKKLLENSAAVAKALRAKAAALHKAEQKIEGLEGRAAEFAKAAQSQRDSLEGKIVALMSELEAERSARSFSEGALRSARSDRQSLHRDAKGEVEAAATPPSKIAANKNDVRVETSQPGEGAGKP